MTEPIAIRCFLRLPMDGKEPGIVSEAELYDGPDENKLDRMMLVSRLIKPSSDDAIAFAALEALQAAQVLGLYPPLWAIEHVTTAATIYTTSAAYGLVTMDKALGLSKGRGKDPAYKSALLADLRYQLMREIWHLTQIGKTVAEAAVMVARRLEADDWNHTAIELPSYKADTLTAYYAADAHLFDGRTFAATDDQRAVLLSHYPAD